MDAIIKHCLIAADLYFAGYYHSQIDDCLKFKICQPLTNIIGSYILPHNELLCYVAIHLLEFNKDGPYREINDDTPKFLFGDESDDESDDENDENDENKDLKTTTYNKFLHAQLIEFSENCSFDDFAVTDVCGLRGYLNVMRRTIVTRLRNDKLISEYNIGNEAWGLPEMNEDCHDKIIKLKKINATFSSKIDKEYETGAMHICEIYNMGLYFCTYSVDRIFRPNFRPISVPLKNTSLASQQLRGWNVKKTRIRQHPKHLKENHKKRSCFLKRIHQPNHRNNIIRNKKCY
jgi:hypothetical protein